MRSGYLYEQRPTLGRNTKAACHAVAVNALDAKARSWWERLGFAPFAPADPTRLDMDPLTADIEATLRSPP